MKITRKIMEMLGISMMVSAVTLVLVFLVLSIRRRSVLAALALLAAAEGTVGLWLLVDARSKVGLTLLPHQDVKKKRT